MKLIDPKLKNHIGHYVLQCLIATGALVIVLFYVDIFFRATVVASIGATSFIIFTMPHKNRGKAKFIIGGYTVGIVCGVLCNQIVGIVGEGNLSILGAVAVGLAMFLMVITNTEHPPAAAIALGITVEGYTGSMLVFIYMVTLFLLLIKWLLRRWLMDLL